MSAFEKLSPRTGDPTSQSQEPGVTARPPEEGLASSAWLRGLGLDSDAPVESAWERRHLQPPTGDLPPPHHIFRRGCVKKGAADEHIFGGGALGFELQDNAGLILCCRHPGRTAD